MLENMLLHEAASSGACYYADPFTTKPATQSSAAIKAARAWLATRDRPAEGLEDEDGEEIFIPYHRITVLRLRHLGVSRDQANDLMKEFWPMTEEEAEHWFTQRDGTPGRKADGTLKSKDAALRKEATDWSSFVWPIYDDRVYMPRPGRFELSPRDEADYREKFTRYDHVPSMAGLWAPERRAEQRAKDATDDRRMRDLFADYARQFAPSTFQLTKQAASAPGPRLIEKGMPAIGTGILWAPTGSYKSFLALTECFAIAAGLKSLWGREVRASDCKRAVVYFAGEDYQGIMSQRLPALYAHFGLPAGSVPLYVVNGCPNLAVPDILEQTLDSIRIECWESVARVQFDTLATMVPGRSMSGDGVASQFGQFATALSRELQCYVEAVAHPGKDLAKGVAGSFLFEAEVDFIRQAIAAKRGPAVRLVVRKNKGGVDGDEQRIIGQHVEVDGTEDGSLLFVTAAADEVEYKAAALGENAELVAALEALGAGDHTTKTVAAQMAGPEATDVRRYAQRLSEAVISGKAADYLAHRSTGPRDPHRWALPEAESFEREE